MNNTVLVDVMRDTAKVRAELREARQAFDTLVRHIEVLHYNFVQNRGGKLGPPARPPDRPCDERLQRVVGLISELLVVVRGVPREKPCWVTAADINAMHDSGDYPDYWWWWNGDVDGCPVPVHVQWSGTGGFFFASCGQFGWNQAQPLTEMGGVWMKIVEPDIPQHRSE